MLENFKSGTEQLDASYETVVAEVKQKLSDPKAAKSERGLFALSEPPTNLAIYSESFHGKAGENIYKFFNKIKDALDWNQVKELMSSLGEALGRRC